MPWLGFCFVRLYTGEGAGQTVKRQSHAGPESGSECWRLAPPPTGSEMPRLPWEPEWRRDKGPPAATYVLRDFSDAFSSSAQSLKAGDVRAVPVPVAQWAPCVWEHRPARLVLSSCRTLGCKQGASPGEGGPPGCRLSPYMDFSLNWGIIVRFFRIFACLPISYHSDCRKLLYSFH